MAPLLVLPDYKFFVHWKDTGQGCVFVVLLSSELDGLP